MSKRTLAVYAALIFAAGISTGLALAKSAGQQKEPGAKLLLDNQRVTVTEVTMAPAARRAAYTRPSDQIIVFLDAADYEATDAAGQKQIKHRNSGEIVWHQKGEAAPLLVNQGAQPYRNLVIALK